MSEPAGDELEEALAALIRERRSCASLLAQESGSFKEAMTRFVELQMTIEAVERAIESETNYD
jgi:hypothetical protein